MPLWIVSHTHAPAALTGVLFALNTVLVVVAQLPISTAVAKRCGIGRSYTLAAAAFCVCGLAFALAAGASTGLAIALLLLALTAQTWAELENTAAEAFLSVELAPPDLRGQYIGFFETSMAVQQAIGPIFVTLAIVYFGRLSWVLIAATTTLATLISRYLAAKASAPMSSCLTTLPEPADNRARTRPSNATTSRAPLAPGCSTRCSRWAGSGAELAPAPCSSPDGAASASHGPAGSTSSWTSPRSVCNRVNET